MALLDKVFKDKKESSEEGVKKEVKGTLKKSASVPSSLLISRDVILRPHITEKASILAESNAYTFEVKTSANKTEIEKAIKELYKVTPKKINIAYSPAKKVITRGKPGVKKGKKKAIVYLEKGDKIEFV